MLKLTDRAHATLERLIAGAAEPLTGLRIAVTSGGCVGLQYGMALVNEPGADDMVVDFGQAKLYVDPRSVDILTGTTIDFVDGADGAGFTFDNPNAGNRCACARSFAA